MSDNPYAPPKSAVQDIVPPQSEMPRPAQIVTAIRLAAIGYGLGIVVILLSWDYYSKLQTVGALIANQLFTLCVLFWLYYKIYMGRNWARITLLVFSVLGALALTLASRPAMELLAAAPTIAKVGMFVGFGLNFVILWLLFLSPGRYWFRRTSGGTGA